MNITKLENACKYLQRNDSNGDYLDMIKEYHEGEIELETIQEVCNNVLNDWKTDLETISQPTQSDLKDIATLQEWIEYIN